MSIPLPHCIDTAAVVLAVMVVAGGGGGGGVRGGGGDADFSPSSYSQCMRLPLPHTPLPARHP